MENYFKLDFKYAKDIIIEEHALKAQNIQKELENKNKENDSKAMLGWLDLPLDYEENPKHKAILEKIKEDTFKINKFDVLVVVGVGGSLLGTRALQEVFIHNPNMKKKIEVIYMGDNLDATYQKKCLDYLKDKKYAVNIISKSGKTLEPALAFRALWKDLESKFGKNLKEHIFVTTDPHDGFLAPLAKDYNLPSYTIPENIGGRYSVFTPVGLLPLSAMGLDIDRLLEGARKTRLILEKKEFINNPALQYSCYRHYAYQNLKKIEIFGVYQSNLYFLGRWWQQLFGESEGKGGKGVFPTVLQFTNDLHSMGQWIQEAERSIFETIIDIKQMNGPSIEKIENDFDDLNKFAGKTIHEINRIAIQASLQAHASGGVPCLRIEVPKIEEGSFGSLLYFFMYSCALSAKMLGVNPFDQPGVETYKKNMQKLL